MRGTPVLLLVVFVGLSSSSEYSDRQRNIDQEDQPAKPFQSGYQYIYSYNGQISSGLGNAPNSQQDGDQKAVSRIEAQAKITFRDSQSATLRLQNIRMGQANQPIDNEKEVQPMGLFERKQVPEDKRQQLELAVQFEYVNGVVGRINFQTEDPIWARNIKRSVLNLLQINLNQQGVQQQDEEESSNQFGDGKTFTISETTIEGNCKTTYTVNPNGKPSQQQDGPEEEQKFNVTKTINFQRCQQIADVAYGYQTQQQKAECVRCQQPSTTSYNEEQQYEPSAECQKCDPKQIKQQQLSRSTMIRFVLQGKDQQNYAIQRAELVSQYIYKTLETDGKYPSGLQTIVAAQLIFRELRTSNKQEDIIPRGDKANTLLFDNQWVVEEKRFYQMGDESGRISPFSEVPQKVEQAQQIILRLVQAASDKQKGIEFHQLTKLQRLVEIFRMCSVEELEQIISQSQESSSDGSYTRSESEQQKQQQLVADCLAMAGTRNTIQVLSDKITSGKLNSQQAFQALRALQGLPAPSDEQVEIVQRLCQHQAVHRASALKQTCWLTFGSMVSELCHEKTGKQEEGEKIFGTQTGFQSKKEMCRSDKKETYKQVLEEQYNQAQNAYEKVLALKAIGNAGLDNTIQHLERIVVDGKEERIQRCQAIDGFRRLRSQMPRKIQRVLLPIFQNTKEHPEVRMAAFAMIMHTLPQQQILDQITYTLTKERQPEVQSMVYTTMKSLAKSKIPEEQNIAKHLKSTLKLAKVNEQTLRPSRKFQVPIYSHEQKDGVFFNFVSAYRNSRSQLPSHLAASMDTLLNTNFQINSLKVSASQQNIEQWYETLLQRFIAASKQESSKTTRGHRSQRSTSKYDNKQELRNIFSGLNIRNRRANSNNQEQNKNEQPFAMVCVRVGDVDQAILPIDQETMPEYLKPVLNGERLSLSEWMRKLQDTQHFRLLSVMNIKEKTARIPTSMGVSLKVVEAMPVMASIEGSLSAKLETSRAESPMGIKAQLKIHPSVCMTSVQKMESCLPIFATGVESTQAIEFNLPIQAEIRADQKEGVTIAFDVPQTPKTHLVGAHSLPSTYTREWDERNKMLKDPKVKAIHYPYLDQSQQEVHREVGKQYFGMPFHVNSQYHRPTTKISSYRQLFQLLMATENHYHLSFNPKTGDGTPRKVILQASGQSFHKVGDNNGPELGNFYSDTHQFQKAHPEDNFEDMQLDGHSQRRQKLNSFLNKFQPGQMYQHSLKLQAKLEGGRKSCQGKIDLKTSCDAQFKFCKSELEVERSALPQENQDWKFKAKVQVLQPQAVNHVQEIAEGKHQKLLCQVESEWGAEKQQNINFRLQGEQAISQQQRQLQTSQQQKKRAAFLNKFDLLAEYKLQPAAQNTFLRGLEMLKSKDPWNTQSQHYLSGRDGQIHATMVIDPINQKQANISISTPSQKVRMESVELKPFGEPIQMRPFPLVRPAIKQSHSAKQLFKRMVVDKAPRSQCTVDGRRVETFDGVLYKAPIGKCYSVLAKDCSSEEPRFAVLMKAIGEDQDSQDKKIKVITSEQTIECKPTGSGSSKKLECYINGQLVDPQQQSSSSEYSSNGVVEYHNEEQTDVSIQLEEGLQVRMSCWCSKCKCQKVEVRLSQQYKQGQCGLCGHFDDQAEDELRMNDNQNTDDLAKFHRSYSFKDDCSSQDQDSLYSDQNKDKFNRKVDRRNKKSNYNSQDSYQQEDQEDYDWQQGGYHVESQEEDNQWDSDRQQKRNSQRGGKNKQNQEEPIEETKVLEFHHKICFSIQPVKMCPEGKTPASGEDDTTTEKIQFACMIRGSVEARQLKRQARKGLQVDVSRLTPNFVEKMQQPRRCVVY